jgi:hypothetical protein
MNISAFSTLLRSQFQRLNYLILWERFQISLHLIMLYGLIRWRDAPSGLSSSTLGRTHLTTLFHPERAWARCIAV